MALGAIVVVELRGVGAAVVHLRDQWPSSISSSETLSGL